MESKGFPLNVPDVVQIVMKIRVQEKLYELVHCFRKPTAEDIKECQRRLNKTEGIGRECRGIFDPGESAEFLWNACIEKVEGYDITDVKDWKIRVPLEHKQWAVERLILWLGQEQILIDMHGITLTDFISNFNSTNYADFG